MKKAFFAIFIFILSSSLHVFSEVEIDGGLGFSHEKEKLKTEEFTFEVAKFNVELMGQLRYYLSKDSKFGFGFSCSIPFSSDNADFDYTGTDSYHIIHDEPYWIQDNSAPVKYFYDVSAFNFSISPDLFYRLNFTESSKMFIAFGPTYGIESRKYLYADEKDAVTRDTGVSKYSGYKVINIEKVKRQHLGLEAQLSYSFGTKFVKTFGIKTAYSFFEKSKFTNNKWTSDFTDFSIGLFVKLGTHFPNFSEYMENRRIANIERLEKEKIEAEEAAAREKLVQEQRKIRDEAEKKYQERIKEFIGDTPVKVITYSDLANPYAFEKDVVYRMTSDVWIYHYYDDGFIGSPFHMQSYPTYLGNVLFYGKVDVTKLKDRVTDLYMMYTGTTATYSGTIPVFQIYYYRYY